MFIATCVGGPAILGTISGYSSVKTYHVPVLVAGLKLGMFAAVGGGIMGYTTGKMFAEHEYSPATFS